MLRRTDLESGSRDSWGACDVSERKGRSASKRHKHEFTALWWNFGPFGRQDVHVHDCFDRECSRVVIGAGRDCDIEAEHHRETLTA